MKRETARSPRVLVACGVMAASLALTPVLSGCLTVGQPFPHKEVGRIKVGETSDKEILAMFGNPVRTGINEGVREWTYVRYRASIFGSFEGRDLVVKFDTEGKVKSISYSSTDPKDPNVKP